MAVDLLAAGFDKTWLDDAKTLFGPDIIKLLEDGLAAGFSKAWLTECVEVLGKDVLEMLISIAKAKHLLGATAKQAEKLVPHE